MQKKWISFGASALFMMAAVLVSEASYGQVRGKGVARSMRSVSSALRTPSRGGNALKLPANIGRGFSNNRGNGRGTSAWAQGLANNLNRPSGSNRNNIQGLGQGGLLNALRQYGVGQYGNNGGYGGYGLGNYWGQYDRHRYEDQTAKAYRDAMIANTVVSMVGMIALTAQNNQCRPQAVAVAAPARPAPQGHWEKQSVVTQPARYEQYQEWIPELYDSHTGQKSGGYYEARTRLIPEVVEQRDVWVTP